MVQTLFFLKRPDITGVGGESLLESSKVERDYVLGEMGKRLEEHLTS
jgi:hypothetical protein